MDDDAFAEWVCHAVYEISGEWPARHHFHEDAAFRAFMANVLEHTMTTQRTPSFREQALRISKTLGLTMTCAVIERNL